MQGRPVEEEVVVVVEAEAGKDAVLVQNDRAFLCNTLF